MYIYRWEGINCTADEIRALFDLTKQEMSVGLTHYHATFPEDRTKHLNPQDLIKRVMTRMKISYAKHYRHILRIARCLDRTDRTLIRSNPASVAAAIVYFYICLTPKLKKQIGFTKTKFARQMKLSDITITKLVKQAAIIIGLSSIEM
jgi:transcription initiation factor TFIIIB Brf1 subunit/transcription initiation factor TFIIB